MGWVLKTAAFLLAIMLFGVGAWPISILVFAILFVPAVRKGSRKRGASGESSGRRVWVSTRCLAAGVLLLLALLGLAAHGTFSPILFGSLGLLALLLGRSKVLGLASGLRPVEETILLRSRFLPISWVAVAEVKPLTKDVGRVLAGLDGTVLVVGPAARIYLVIEKRASNERSAQDVILATLREISHSISPVGGYLLPLDSARAFNLLRPPMQRVEFGGRFWSNALMTRSFDAILIEQDGGFARKLGLMKRTEGKSDSASLSFGPKALAKPPFLLEVYKELGNRLTWPQPDQVTAFLSSLSATRGEPTGARFLELEEVSAGQVSVRSVGGPSVELSKAELRAVAMMLGQ